MSNKIERNLYNSITTIHRNNEIIKFGYGTWSKNPSIVTKKDFILRRKILWIFYDNDWYIISNSSIKTELDLLTYLHNHPTYCKEQLFELVYGLVM